MIHRCFIYSEVKGAVSIEALHHIPGLDALNAFGFDHIGLQIVLLICGVLLYTGLTCIAYNKACADFEKIDL